MLFSSSVFLFLFLPLVLLGYYGLCSWLGRFQGPARNLLLLLSSLFFYAWGEPWFVLVMLCSILANHCFGLWIERRRSRGQNPDLAVFCALVYNLGILFLFKYLTFLLTQLNCLGLSLPVPGIELPLGLSFFTFQGLSYVLDINASTSPAQRSLFKTALYISFFPQLIAGPIVKYSTIAEELDSRQESWADFSYGVCRFLVGLGKKVLLSNQLVVIADAAFDLSNQERTVGLAWLGAICYTLQIYYDFSGYSDMAIGLGRMFGFHFQKNFNYPYISKSVTEFWRRWHISLSSWFRDYVYIPLGGSRVGTRRHLRNLLVVWLLTGIWHGANWTFLVWGLFYFLLLALEKFLGLGNNWPQGIRWLYTMLMVTLGWVLFRADSLAAAASYFQTMFFPISGWWNDLATLYLLENRFLLPLAFLLCAPVVSKATNYLSSRRGHLALAGDMCQALTLLLIFVLSAAFLIKGTYNPFIYFNF